MRSGTRFDTRKIRTTKIFAVTPDLTIIYSFSAPAQSVNLIYTKPAEDAVNLTCSASGAFPQPEVRISWGPR